MSFLTPIINIFRNNKERNDKVIDNVSTKSVEDYQELSSSNIHLNYNLDIVDIAPNIYLVNRAGRICIGMGPTEGYQKKKEHVKRMSDRGHESPFEHTNAIVVVTIYKDKNVSNYQEKFFAWYTEFMAAARYAHVRVRKPKENNNVLCYLLIGGSSRAYFNMVRETSTNNIFRYIVLDILDKCFEKEILYPLVNDGIISEEYLEEYCNYEAIAKNYEVEDDITQNKNKYEVKENKGKKDIAEDSEYIDPAKYELKQDRCDLLYNTDLAYVYNYIKSYGFSIEDVYDVATVSFLFHNISRACYDQMARHRVAISTESQRYVEHKSGYSNFIDPVEMNPERYSSLTEEEKHKLRSGDPFRLYNYALKMGLQKEDARAWLPMNANIKSMMTFTYKQLAHFIDIRSEKAAQTEVRKVTDEIMDAIAPTLVFTAKLITPFTKDALTYICDYEPSDNDSYNEQSITSYDEATDEELKPEDMKAIKIDSIEQSEQILKKAEEYGKIKE